MPKYVIRRHHADDDFDPYWDAGNDTSIQVHEPDNEPVPTGLVDIHGNSIMRLREKRPIGFIRKG
jgi:hypothetical protein